MKRTAMFIVIITIILGMFMISNNVYAANDTVIDSDTESKLIEIKENTVK